MSIELNDNHRRALRSAFKEVERALEDFERLLDKARRNQGGVSLDAAKTQAAQRKIDVARKRLNMVKTHLGVKEDKEIDPVWAIRVGVSRLWEMLEDCKSERLRGYGEVPELSKPTLDKHIQKLIDALEEIARTLS